MAKLFPTIVATACVKSVLMALNLVFWASGLAIFCAGIWMQVELSKYLHLNDEFPHMIRYILLWTGAFILLISTLGCCCTIKGHPTLLYLYAGLLACILFVELAVATSLYSNKNDLTNGFERGLNNSMKKYGQGDGMLMKDFDYMQEKLHCCGCHSYQDWRNLPAPISVPQSCCKKTYCDTQIVSDIFTEGCYEKVANIINENITTVLLPAIIVALFLQIGVILMFCLGAHMTKMKYEEVA